MPLLHFSNLSQFSELAHGVSTRTLPDGQPFNLSFRCGASDDVRANHAAFLKLLGDPFDVLLDADQTHGDRIYVHRQGDAFPNQPLEGYDGFVSDAIGVGFLVKTADCQAISLYDPVRRAVGLVHCGWRGSVQNVVGKTIRIMRETFGAEPGRLVAGIGPSLGPCCAEFSNPHKELGDAAAPHFIEKNRVDFWAMTQGQLMQAGLLPEKIECSSLCTACDPKRFFSHRADKAEQRGRFGSVIGLRRS